MNEPIVDPCVVDLTRDDEYPDGVVPDADFETCLKVLRTVKNVLINPPRFRPSESMTLVKAHSTLVALCEEVQRNERAERAEGNNG